MVWETAREFIARLSYILFRSPGKPNAETKPDEHLSDASILSPPLVGDRYSDIDLIVSLYDKSIPKISVNPTTQGGPLWTSADTNLELMGNVEYRNGRLVGATMSVLVRKMTPLNPPVDPFLYRVFFLTFRLFSNPRELAEALIFRYCVSPPQGLSLIDLVYWQREVGAPIRRQVFQFIKTWLESYWVPVVDDKAISALKALIKKRSMSDLPPWSAYVIRDLLHKRTPSGTTIDIDVSKSGVFNNQVGVTRAKVRMNYSLRASLEGQKFKKINLTDFDPLEFARQLTIIESQLFCALRPEDILANDGDNSTLAKSIQDINRFGARIKRWVCESILKPYCFTTQGSVIRFFIKVATNCMRLNNFTTSRSILEALESQQNPKLYWALQGLPKRQKLQLSHLRRLLDRSNNHSEYRMKLQNVTAPAVPWLDLYVLDVTFCRDCYPPYRQSAFRFDPRKRMINLTKYYKLVDIYEDMHRFQVQYDLEPVPGFQDYITTQFGKVEGRDSLNRRSSSMRKPKQEE